ncbi:hypothetical protein [Haloferula sp. BvORR071]|uniref:hypothetical protein n=1 Tax=Haloferula sp. BvORR071 TaxID=1396141 RepID=UPI002240ED9C|nr:hypothetical protein [Haloferula sp. BvORR071]
MKHLRFVAALLLLWAISFSPCQARPVQSKDMKQLMQQSALVLVGKILTVAPSGLTTDLSYPTWNGVVFEWLKVEVEVVEPIKATTKGEKVRTLMLSTRGDGPMINPPGMVDPKVGQHHLLCLLPTTTDGVYASLTAPFDDDQSIILLDRKDWARATYYDDKGKEVAFQDQNDKNRALWSLVDAKGSILPDGAAAIRKQYKAEIATPVAKDQVIHLKWKTQTGKGGWQWNVPDEEARKKK